MALARLSGFSRLYLIVGIALILLAALVNTWTLENWYLPPDLRIRKPLAIALVYLFQVVCAGTGLSLLIRKPRPQLILLVGLVGLISFGTAELTARIWLGFIANEDQRLFYGLYTDIPDRLLRFIPHHYLNYCLNSPYSHGPTHHNALGFRGPDFPKSKPPGTFRIATIGGSTTYTSTVVDDAKTYPSQLERVLREKYGYHNVEVINAGVSGYDSWECLINLEFRVLDVNPDLIIVYLAFNDVASRLVEPSAYRSDNSGKRQQFRPPKILVWERSAFLRLVLRTFGLTPNASVDGCVWAPTRLPTYPDPRLTRVLKENPPVYFRRNLENMVAIAKHHGIRIMFATFACSVERIDAADSLWKDPVYRSGIEEHNRVVREVAEKNQAPLFDFASSMPQDKGYWADGVHVTEDGALIKASLFAEFIDKIGIIMR